MATAKGFCLLISGAALASCAVGPNYRAPRTATPDQFIAASAQPPSVTAVSQSVDYAQWWRALNDPQLDSLIERAIRANPDIEIALTRLQEARTQQAALLSDILPQAGAGGGAGHGTGSDLARGDRLVLNLNNQIVDGQKVRVTEAGAVLTAAASPAP